jgi:uncharacterized protein YndB with AHSA1/START domain
MTATDARMGTLETADGQLTLRFDRRLAHPIDRVWKALVDPDDLAQWYPQTVTGEWRVGGKLRFLDSSMPDQPFEGVVTEFDPPRLLAHSWGDDFLRWELAPDGPDATRLVLLNRIVDRSWPAWSTGAGWHACLDALALALDGAVIPWTVAERAKALEPGYRERLGSDEAGDSLSRPEG